MNRKELDWKHLRDKFDKLPESSKTRIKNMLTTPKHRSGFLNNIRNEFDNFMFEIDVKDIDPTKEFKHMISNIKILVVVILLCTTLIYQIRNKNVPLTKTFIDDPFYRKILLEQIILTFLCTFTAYSIIWWSRTGLIISKKQSLFCVTLAFVVSFYVFAEELSGFNRWLSKRRTLQGKGPYFEIDEKDKVDEPDKIIDETGEPFITSFGIFAFVLLGLIVVYFGIKLLYVIYIGYKSKNNEIGKLKYILGKKTNNPIRGFMLETLLFLCISVIPFVLFPFIRKEKFVWHDSLSVVFMIIVYLIIHLSFQWTGSMPKINSL